jgi:hypothetical protein
MQTCRHIIIDLWHLLKHLGWLIYRCAGLGRAVSTSKSSPCTLFLSLSHVYFRKVTYFCLAHVPSLKLLSKPSCVIHSVNPSIMEGGADLERSYSREQQDLGPGHEAITSPVALVRSFTSKSQRRSTSRQSSRNRCMHADFTVMMALLRFH